MKKINQLIILLCLPIFLFGQDSSWQFIGGPEGLRANTIFKTFSGNLICGVEYGGIYLSDNDGEAWRQTSLQSDIVDIQSIVQHIDGTIYASCDFGIIRSEDEGVTWSLIYAEDFKYNYVKMEIDDDGVLYYFVNLTGLYKSIDNGITWIQIWSGEVADYTLNNSGHILISTRHNTGLFKSIDKGLNWSEINLTIATIPGRYIAELYSNSDSLLYLKFTSWGELYWINEFTGNFMQINSNWYDEILGFTPQGNLMSGYGKSIAEYNQKSNVWKILSSPYFVKNQMGREAIWLNDSTCIVNYSAMGIFKSTDKGKNWKLLNRGLGYKPCFSIETAKPNRILTGYFTSSFWGGICYSDNEGSNWNEIRLNAIYPPVVNDISKINEKIIVSSYYGSFVSNNDGDTWKKTSDMFIYSQYVSKSGRIFVGNDYNGIYKSDNEGNSWSAANNGINHSYFFAFGESNTGRIFAGAWPSGTYYSDNNGDSWASLENQLLSSTRAYDYLALEDTIYAGTSSGLMKSVDDGLTWKKINGINGLVYDIFIAPSNDIIVSNWGEGVFLSSDFGKTWNEFNYGLNNLYIREITIDDSNYIYLASNEGIYKNRKYAKNLIQNLPNDFEISSAYPNPFNSKLHILCRFNESFEGKLEIYNLLGKKIWERNIITNVNEIFTWDGNNLNNKNVSSGIYFLQLKNIINSKVSNTKKVLFVK